MNLATALAAALASVGAILFLSGVRREHPGRGGPSALLLAAGLAAGGLLERVGWLGLRVPADLYVLVAVVLSVGAGGVLRSRRADVLGAVIAALAALFLLAAAVSTGHAEAEPARGPLLVLHILFVGAAAGTLLIAGGASALYLLKARGLRQAPRGFTHRLPRLETLSRVLDRSLAAGMLLLTGGVALGSVVMAQTPDRMAASGLLVTVTLTTWAALGGVLVARRWRGVSATLVARVTLAMVGVLLLTVLLSFGLTPLRHGGG